MSEQMRSEFEACWSTPNEEQGIYFVPELNVYGAELARNSEMADMKSSAWYYWQASRAALCVEIPEPRYGMMDHDRYQAIKIGIRMCRDAIHAAGVKTK